MSDKIGMKVFNILVDSTLAKGAGYMAELAKRISATGVVVAEVNKQLMNLIKSCNITDKFIMIRIEIYTDKSFKLSVHRNSQTSRAILNILGLEKAAKKPGHDDYVANITHAQIREIALKKMIDMNLNIDQTSLSFQKDLESAMKMIAGTAKSMHIKVVE